MIGIMGLFNQRLPLRAVIRPNAGAHHVIFIW
jgi:hypothetical protein